MAIKKSEKTEKNEQGLITECRKIISQRISPGSEAVVRGYWELGTLFIQYEAEGWIERKRGEEVVKRVAAQINLGYVSLYAAISFAERFPKEKNLDELIETRKRDNLPTSWSAIRTNILPRYAGVKKEAQTDELLSEGEKLATQLEKITTEIKMREHETNEQQKEMLVNVRKALSETVEDAHAVFSMFLPKKRREESETYLKWLKMQKEWRCIISSKPDPDPHHLRTVGAGGSDFDVVPLDREYHQKIEEPGFWTTQRLVALFHWAYEKRGIDARFVKSLEG